jgi:hypothetical protein
MPGALSPVVELRLRLVNWRDDNAVAIVSDRGMYLGYVSAERALLISKQMKESQTVALFQAMHGSGAYIRIRFAGGVPTQPRPRCSETLATPLGLACASTGLRSPRAFYRDEDRAGVWSLVHSVERNFVRLVERGWILPPLSCKALIELWSKLSKLVGSRARLSTASYLTAHTKNGLPLT